MIIFLWYFLPIIFLWWFLSVTISFLYFLLLVFSIPSFLYFQYLYPMTRPHREMLRSMYIKDSKQKHPLLPDHARPVPKYSDTTEKAFIRSVVDFLKFSGHQAERIDNKGTRIDNRQVVTNTLGHMKTIGSVTWHYSQHTKGTADIHAIIKPKDSKYGVAVKIELKVGKDRIRPAQIAYKQSVEEAGGAYWLCHTFEEFLNMYREFTDC